MTGDMVKSPEKSAGRHPRKTLITQKNPGQPLLMQVQLLPSTAMSASKRFRVVFSVRFFFLYCSASLVSDFCVSYCNDAGFLVLVSSDWFPVKMIQFRQFPSYRHHLHTFKRKKRAEGFLSMSNTADRLQHFHIILQIALNPLLDVCIVHYLEKKL